MTTTALKQVNFSLREEWLQIIQDLQGQIKTWVHTEPGWSALLGEGHEIEESPLGVYTVTHLDVHTPDGRLILEPIARNYPGAGVVELYAWPTLFRVRLMKNTAYDGWRVRTDSGIFLRQDWSRENFVTLVNDLLAADG